MIERIEPVDIPGVPPLNRHTYLDDAGNPLPEVRYSYRRGARLLPRWDTVLISIVAAGLGTLLGYVIR